MAKSSNPVDAHRKLQRKQELKRNKQKREQTREISTVKKDTRPIEAEIRRLSQQAQKGPLAKDDKDELAHLKAEFARINKAKHEYVEAHPEHRKYVFPERPQDPSASTHDEQDSTPGLYDKNGRLKHPERSLYYDPVFNPFGAPPPGMPYREKPEYAMARMGPTPEEIAAFQPVGGPQESESESDEDEDDDDDDIAMPAGPPPGAPGTAAMKDSDSDSDSSSSDDDDEDDIPLPPGPPPPKSNDTSAAAGTSRHMIAFARPSASSLNSLPPPPPHTLPARPNFPPPPPPGGVHFHAGAGGGLPPARHHPHHHVPPPPPRHFARPPPPGMHMSDPLNLDGNPNRAYQQQQYGRQHGPVQPPPPPGGGYAAPPPPPLPTGPSPFFAVPGSQHSTTIASSSSSNPTAPAGPSSSLSSSSSATISAAPQLRDLKKEATAFVPLAMRKKLKAQQATLAKAGLTSINAARGSSGGGGSGAVGGEGAEDGGGEGMEAPVKKRTLMDEMRERGIGASAGGSGSRRPAPSAATTEDAGGADDYERFREEMADLL